MTVCVAIKVHDCIVFAADSAVTLSSGSGVANIWEHGNKVYNLHRGLPIVAMTSGMGQFGSASISNLAKDLRLSLTSGSKAIHDTYTIEEVADSATDFFKERYDSIDPPPPNPHKFEFWIGGYDSRNTLGEIRKLVIQDGTVHDIELVAKGEDDDMVVWGGQTKAISRLINGLDIQGLDALVDRGMSPQDIASLRSEMVTPLVHSSMPVQDAIDLADFLVDLTKKYHAFLPGANIVGGDSDIATVTKHEGFKWIRRKHYYPPDLNPGEIDHAT